MAAPAYWRFGPKEWTAYFGVTWPAGQLRRIPDFPSAAESRLLDSNCSILPGRLIRETSFAFLGLDQIDGEPLTIEKLHEMLPEPGQPHLYLYEPPRHEFGRPVHVESPWYIRGRYAFAVEKTCEFRWYLMPLYPLLTNRHKPVQEQLAAIPSGYEWADAVVELVKRVLFFRLTGIRIRHVVHVAGPGPVSIDVSIGGVSENGIRIADGYQHGAVALTRTLPTPE